MSPSNRYFADVEVVLDETDGSICRSLKIDGVEFATRANFISDVPFVEVLPLDESGLGQRRLNISLSVGRLSVATEAAPRRNANPHDQTLPCGGDPK